MVSSLGSFLPEKYQPTTHKNEDVGKATAEAAATAAQSPPESAVFSLRRADEMSLEQWVRMEAKEPLILSGHPGTGKLTLVRQVIHTTGMEDVVHIDVKSMLEKKDDMMVCTVGSCWDCFSEGSCVCAWIRFTSLRRRSDFSQASAASKSFRKSSTSSRLVRQQACQ